jgi:16S rRNA (adenine1518-N6/adenine1519-N6)-dimethyltransferase
MSSNPPHRARKRFGQNFLIDQNIIERIVKAINPAQDQALIEIGPGQGAITEKLLTSSGQLDVIEIDRDLAAQLQDRFGTNTGFTLHISDVLKFDFDTLPSPQDGFRILGNLPYNISTPLLFHLLNYHEKIHDMVFMLQLEVVKRMVAGVGDNNYGRLGIMIQYYCAVEKLFTVPANAFNPAPKVESAIVKLSPHTTLPFPAQNTKMLEQVVRTAFTQRRKTIRNSLKNLLSAEQLEELNIDNSLRPENISLQDYVRISDFVTQQN